MAIFESIFHNDQLMIIIKGKFIFEDRKKFTAAYEHIPYIEDKKILIDLTNSLFLDSTALQLLLILRECCGGNSNKITLKISGNTNITKIIQVTKFEQLFTIA